jgi:hypothetical protein
MTRCGAGTTSTIPAVQEAVKTLHRLARERFARHAKWFEALAEKGRVTELSGAHHLFISHPVKSGSRSTDSCHRSLQHPDSGPPQPTNPRATRLLVLQIITPDLQ